MPRLDLNNMQESTRHVTIILYLFLLTCYKVPNRRKNRTLHYDPCFSVTPENVQPDVECLSDVEL